MTPGTWYIYKSDQSLKNAWPVFPYFFLGTTYCTQLSKSVPDKSDTHDNAVDILPTCFVVQYSINSVKKWELMYSIDWIEDKLQNSQWEVNQTITLFILHGD